MLLFASERGSLIFLSQEILQLLRDPVCHTVLSAYSPFLLFQKYKHTSLSPLYVSIILNLSRLTRLTLLYHNVSPKKRALI